MTLRQLLIIMSIATGICWLAWIIVIFNMDPDLAGISGFVLFYGSLFFALLGSFFMLTFAIRKVLNKLDMEYKIVSISFRQSFFFAGLFILILFLQSKSLLKWWNLILVVLALSMIEFLFLSTKKVQ